MLAHLSGTVLKKGLGFVIIDVGGVGYRVNVSNETLSKIPTEHGSSVSLFTHLAVRENAMDLFGFSEEHEMMLFELLIGVSGIGPRSALAILSLAPALTLENAIGKNDVSYLTKVSGIGKKTAEKIVLELKDKVGRSAMGPELTEDADVIDVLVSLGYSQSDARNAVKKIDSSSAGTSGRIKEALKILGQR